MDETKEKINWQRLAITIGIVLVTAAAVGGTIWYLMDQNAKSIADSNTKSISILQKQVDELKKKPESTTTTNTTGTTGTDSTSNTLNDSLVSSGYYVLDGQKFTMNNGTYTSGIYQFTLESKYNSYSTDRNTVAVVVKQTSGGTGVFRHLVILGNFKGKATFISEVELGDRVQISSVNLKDSSTAGISHVVSVAMVGFGKDDPSCCPSVSMTKTFNLTTDSKLIEQ